MTKVYKGRAEKFIMRNHDSEHGYFRPKCSEGESRVRALFLGDHAAIKSVDPSPRFQLLHYDVVRWSMRGGRCARAAPRMGQRRGGYFGVDTVSLEVGNVFHGLYHSTQ